MKRKEYKLLVENWNNFLLEEEKVFLLEKNLVQDFLIRESFINSLRKKGIKNSVMIPILLIKAMSLVPNTAFSQDLNNNLPTFEEVQEKAEDVKGISKNDFTETDFKQACKVYNKLELFGEKDFNEDRGIFSKIFNKSNDSDIEDMFKEVFKRSSKDPDVLKANKMFPGVYTKVTAKCLGPNSSEEATKKIYDTIGDLFKQKSENVKKVNVSSDFDLYIGKMDTKNYKKYAAQITKIFFDGKLTVKKDGKNLEALKKEILKEVANSFYKLIEGKNEKALTYPYHYFTYLFHNAIEKMQNKGILKGINISIEDIQDGSHGGLILLSSSSNEAVIEHELGHIISMNFEDVKQNTNNAYYDFVSNLHQSKKEIFTLKDVVDFLVTKVSSQYNLDLDDINDLSESGKLKIVKNSKLLIGMLIGAGGVEELKNGKFKLKIDDTRWDVYLHSLEERIETIHHSLIEKFNLNKSSLIKLLTKIKKDTKKASIIDGGKKYPVSTYSEWQFVLKNKGYDFDMLKSIISLIGQDNMSVKKYSKENTIQQIDNLIKLTDANF